MAWYDNLPINAGYSWVEGTTTGSYDMNYVKTWMEWLVTTDSANNRSIINVKMYSQVIQGGTASDMAKWTTAENFGYAGYDNSNRVYRSTTYDFNNYNRNCFADTTLYVPHNADGTKSITLQTAFTTHSSTVTGGSVSKNLTLETIAKGTQLISVTGLNYGYPSAFNMSRKASNLRERVTMSYGGETLTIKDTDNADVNFTYTLPRSKTPNTTKPSPSSWSIKVYTYNGATLIDTKSYGETWTIKDGDDANYAPTITVNPTCKAQNSGWTGAITALSDDTCVAQYSKLRVFANLSDITTKHNATITGNNSRKVKYSSGETIYGLNNTYYESNIQYGAGEVTWTYTVTDSRGFTTTKTGNYTVLSSNAPRMDILECYRGNSGGTADESGQYIWVKVTYDRDSLNGHNLISTKTAQANGYSAVNLNANTRTSIATTASASNTYTVTFTVTDLLRTQTYYRTIPSEDLPINIREYGHGVGIGTKATVSGQLNIGYDIYAKNKKISYDNSSGNADTLVDGERFYAEEFSPNPSTYDQNGYKAYSQFRGGSLSVIRRAYSSGSQTDYDECYVTDTGISARDNITSDNAFLHSDYFGMNKGTDIHVSINRSRIELEGRYFATSNLVDIGAIRQGSVGSNGIWNSDSKRVSTDFSSKLSSSQKYIITSQTFNGSYIETVYYYNSSKTQIGYSNFASQTATVTTPSNCQYVRIQFYNLSQSITPSEVYRLTMEKGDTASPYAPPYMYDGEEVTAMLRPTRYTYYHSTSVARTTSLDYSGTNLTLPQGWYVIQAQAVANNNGIQAIALVNTYSGTNYELMDYQEPKNITGYSMGRLAVKWCGFLDFNSTSIKVFVKYSGTGVNQVLLRAKRLV